MKCIEIFFNNVIFEAVSCLCNITYIKYMKQMPTEVKILRYTFQAFKWCTDDLF